MRNMMKVMVIVKATKGSEAGELPTEELLTAMGKFNEELVKAGVMKAGEGLKPSSAAKRVHFHGSHRTVTDGPFAETMEQLGGYYIIDVDDLDEAIAIAARLPPAKKGTVEIRPLFDLPELPQLNSGASL